MIDNGNFIENDTFRSGDEFHFNACVGQNGINTIDTYGYGYDEGTKKLIEAAIEDFSDFLILPIVFMARHRIELFLKRNIRITEEYCSIISNSRIYDSKMQEKHDLQKLWEYLKWLCEKDKRLQETLTTLEPFVVDYFKVDLTGQTFRYPFSLMGEHHLDNLYHINLLIFRDRYLGMSAQMENMDYIAPTILYEYQQGTFTNALSRWDIETISKKLPPEREWNRPSFDTVRNKLKEEYNLSSNQLSKAINIIKNHREFTANINLLNPVEEINEEDVSFLLKSYINFTEKKQKGKWHEAKQLIIEEMFNQLDSNAIFAWLAFYDIGYFDNCRYPGSYVYSEEYIKLIDRHKKEAKDPHFYVFCKLFGSRKELDYIKKGMKKCGQTHLLSKFPI